LVQIEQRIVRFASIASWAFLLFFIAAGLCFFPFRFTLGIASGGLIAVVNFHLLSRTLKKSLNPKKPAPMYVVLGKYYIRFTASGLLIFVLISRRVVHPVGLFIGVSVVVAGIAMALLHELKNTSVKEAC
jgi:hypothetical protein